MQKWLVICLVTLCFPLHLFAQGSYNDKVNKYIDKYKWLAISEQKRYGVPAAIILGQGILETEAGCSELVTGANNHFGIKCKSGWMGETFAHTDDAPNECFRKYKCADDSYRDHSDYLKKSPRYASLFQLSQTDYAAWAIGLRKCGYATNPHYAQQLIKIIEDFHLQEYTYAALNNDPLGEDTSGLAKTVNKDSTTIKSAALKNDPFSQPVNNIPVAAKTAPATVIASVDVAKTGADITILNGLKAVLATKGEMLLKYAIKYNIRYEKLLAMNDLPDAPLAANTYIYLENKNTYGAHDKYVLSEGETLAQISQLEGIQLKRLLNYNHLNPGETPVPGTVLQLKTYAAVKPQLVSANNRTMPVHQQRAAQNVNVPPPVAKQGTIQTATPTVYSTPPPPAVTNKTTAMPFKRDTVATKLYAATSTPTPVAINHADVGKPAAHYNTQVAVGTVTKINADSTLIIPVKEEKVMTPAAEPRHQQEITDTRYLATSVDKRPANTTAVTYSTPASRSNSADTAAVPAGSDPALERLKSQLDRVVYADYHKSPAAARQVTQPAAEKPKEGEKYYTVKKGDTAYTIAKENNITMHQLMEWNDLDFDAIKVGQKLIVKPK